MTATEPAKAPQRQAIVLRSEVEPTEEGDIKVYLPKAAISASDQKEFVSNDRYEVTVKALSPQRLMFDDILFKSDFIRTFMTVADLIDVTNGQTVLELGASHGWASVLIKYTFPGAYVVTSDLVPECVGHAQDYERALATLLDEKWAFSVRDIPFADEQFDRIFTFASFHHFGDKGKYAHSMTEIARILKPGGKLVLLYEPSSPAFLYPFAYRRVNRNRSHEGVDEDVLVIKKLRQIGVSLGLSLQAAPFPIFQYRSSVGAAVYYYLVSKLRLGKLLVCTTNIIMQKKR